MRSVSIAAAAAIVRTGSYCPSPMFNPDARLHELPLHDGDVCVVMDDALAEPARLVELACRYREDFREVGYNAYPGRQLPLPEAFTAQLTAQFDRAARNRLGGRRTLHAHSRLALVTTAPDQLAPAQRLPHRDRLQGSGVGLIAASVLYLFEDETLGGTAFYRPRRPAAEIDALLADAQRLAPAEFDARHGVPPAYVDAGNAWFERTAVVAPRYNRLIFYRGDLFHSGQIPSPERLSADPARGRLSLNGFFGCRAALA